MEHELMQAFGIAQDTEIDVNTISESSAESWLRFIGGRVGGKYLDMACKAAKADGYRLIEVSTCGDFELHVGEVK